MREPANSQCLFAQAFHQSADATAAQYRRAADRTDSSLPFSVNFVNEAGIDAGGVSRDALTEIVTDLHGLDFNLFLLCPNGVNKINSNMDKYLPNPTCVSPLSIQMFEFVGKLMGVSLRAKATLPFSFPSLVWKVNSCHSSNSYRIHLVFLRINGFLALKTAITIVASGRGGFAARRV